MKTFAETLKEIRDGDLATELSEKVRQLVEAVTATQKGGKLVLTLSVGPMKKGTNMLLVEDTVKLALPEPERESTTVMFPTEDNELTRRDPRQPKLPEMGVVRPMAERIAESNG